MHVDWVNAFLIHSCQSNWYPVGFSKKKKILLIFTSSNFAMQLELKSEIFLQNSNLKHFQPALALINQIVSFKF